MCLHKRLADPPIPLAVQIHTSATVSHLSVLCEETVGNVRLLHETVAD